MSEDGPSDLRLDADLLERIADRFEGTERFSQVQYLPSEAPDSVVLEFDLGYFPAAVDRAYVRIRWFTGDDFNIHYSEQYEDGTSWECRWDRHPNSHNTRSHFHPPPDAATPGEDMSYPTDWRDVLASVVGDLDARIRSFW